MKINTFKSIATMIAICFLSFGMMSSSQAAITSLSAYGYDDWGYGGNVEASLTADEDIYVVDWYIDDIYIKSSVYYEAPTRSVYAYLDTRTGGIKGIEYEVKAIAWYFDENDMFVSDTETDDVRVYAPKFIYGVKQPSWEKPNVTGVYGYVELSRHYHDGQNIVVDGYVHAYNGTDETCHATSWFRHTEYDANLFPTGWSKQDPPFNAPNPATPIGPGEWYDNYGSSAISYKVGGDIGEDQVIVLNAHVHLAVSGNGAQDVWHETDHAWTHTFDYWDNQ